MAGNPGFKYRYPLIRFHVLLALYASSHSVLASPSLPEGADIQHGDINISVNQKHMNIGQSSKYGIVNWDSFNISKDHGVHFDNGSGSTLNRVTGTNASQIQGRLTGTGNVYLLNKNGIVIGPDGEILTGGDFVASTLNITDQDFIDGGGFTLFEVGSHGEITNLGKISSLGGDVILSGYKVSNQGEIKAEQGRVGLLTGAQIDVLSDASWAGGAFSVKVGESGNHIHNQGSITARVAELRANNGNIYALAGNKGDSIQVTAVSNEGGKVFLTAPGGTVQSSGIITAKNSDNGGEIQIEASLVENYGGTQDVSGKAAGKISVKADQVISDTEMLAVGSEGAGGQINIEASKEILLTSAGIISADGNKQGGEVAINANQGKVIFSGKVSASNSENKGGKVSLVAKNISTLGGEIKVNGGSLGGEVNIGGGYQGQDIWQTDTKPFASVENAQSTYVSATTRIEADAGQVGDGGKVNVWADGTTQFAGTISARGGESGGDGGRVETSGLAGLGVSGSVDTNAPAGTNGSWLLDPKNITIADTTDAITEFQRVVGSTGGEPTNTSSWFGRDVDIDGETVIISSNDYSTTPAGVYVFENGSIAARLTDGTSSTGNNFGVGLAVAGDAVGVASQENYSESISTDTYNYYGKMHIFLKGSGWQNGTTNRVATSGGALFINGTGNDGGFGRQVEAYQTGADTLFYVSAPEYDSIQSDYGADSGLVLRYSYNSTYDNLNREALRPSLVDHVDDEYAGRRFGSHIAVNKQGAWFVTSDGAWQDTLNINGSDRTDIIFSGPNSAWSQPGFRRMAADGDNLVWTNALGQITLAEFDFSADFSNPSLTSTHLILDKSGLTPPYNDAYGFHSLDISGDTIVAGAPRVSDVGAAYFIREPVAGWSSCALDCLPELTIDASGSHYRSGLGLGYDVAIDGDTAVLGDPRGHGIYPLQSPETGEAKLITRAVTNGSWAGAEDTLLVPGEPNDRTAFGRAVAVDGDTFIVSDSSFGDPAVGQDSGAIYVYENDALAALLKPDLSVTDPVTYYSFGYDADISGDTIVAISRGSGNSRTFVFDKSFGWKNGLSNLKYSYLNSDPLYSATSVAVDGDQWVTGYSGPNGTSPGYAYVFENNNSPTLALTMPVDAGDAHSRDVVVDISGDTIVVGAYEYASPVGFLSVFENTADNWATATRYDLTRNGSESLDNDGFASSVGIDGNTIVAGFHPRISAPSALTTQGVYVYERDTAVSPWLTSPTARLNVPVTYFGHSVAIDDDLIAVSNSAINGANTAEQQIYLFQRQSGWQDDDANLVTSIDSSDDGVLGYDLAIDGNTIIASGRGGDVRTTADLYAYQYKGPFDLETRSLFATNPSSDLNISVDSLISSLSFGSDITLQANNDINLLNPLLVDNVSGNGGMLTLQAGRSVLINADITTDNADLLLKANDSDADGANRDAGEGVVVLGSGVQIDTGTADVVIQGGDRFENRSGNSSPFLFDALDPGRFLIYETTPLDTGAPDLVNLGKDLDMTGRSFIQYNLSFDSTDIKPTSLPEGSGFIYSVNPLATVDVDDQTITYGDDISVSSTLTDLSVGGTSVTASDFGILSTTLEDVLDASIGGSATFSPAGFVNAGFYSGALQATPKSNIGADGVYGFDVTVSASGDLLVNQKNLTATAEDITRTYGDDNPTLNIVYSGFASGENESVLDTAPTATTAAVYNSDVIPGGYTITAGGGSDDNYLISHVDGTLTITPRDMYVRGVAASHRVYNGSTSTSLIGSAYIDPIAGDSVSLGGSLTATARFEDKNVGKSKAVTVSGFVLNGSDAGNYNLLQPARLKANIYAAKLEVEGLTAEDKVYDGSSLATLNDTAYVSAFSGDSVYLSGPGVGYFSDKNVANGKTVSLSGYSLAGADANNYSLVLPSLKASITPAELALSGLTASNKVYDGNTIASLSGTPNISPFGSDQVNLSGSATGTFIDRHVGIAKSVNVTGYSLSGLDAENYTLISPVGLVADITPADLLLSGLNSEDRVYDGTTEAILSGSAFVTQFSGDDVSLIGSGEGYYADPHVGDDKEISLSGLSLSGSDAGNYNLVYPTTLSSDVTPLAVGFSGIHIDSKIYDGSIEATASGTAVIDGILPGDSVTINRGALSYTFVDKNVGTNKAVVVSGVTLLGADSGNYTTTAVRGVTGEIIAKELSLSGVKAEDKVYDSTTEALLTGGEIHGVITGDQVNLDSSLAEGMFADKHVASNKTVTVSGYQLSGADALNYSLLQPDSLAASITPADLMIDSISADKTYDGTTIALLSGATLRGGQGLDALLLDSSAVTASFEDKLAEDNKALFLTGNYVVTGADSGNYNLIQPTGLTADISKKLIGVEGLSIADKEYDGTTAAQLVGSGTFGGLISGDDVQINVGTLNASFSDKHAAENKPIVFTGVSLTGADAANYTAEALTGVTASITTRPVVVTGVTALDKVYDGTTIATLSGGASLQNILAGDAVSLNGAAIAGVFADKHVGNGKEVTASGYLLHGVDASNYSLIQPTGLNASISPADLELSGLSADHKIYDASVTAFLSGTHTITPFAGDDVSIATVGSAEFSDKNVGTDKLVTLSGYSLGGADSGNYNFILPTDLTATISKAALLVTGLTAEERAYDATDLASLSGIAMIEPLGADQLTLQGAATGRFNDKHVADDKTIAVSGLSLSGVDAGNYSLLPPTDLTANITPADLQLFGLIADDRVYDGTTLVPLSGAPNFTVFGTDEVTLAGSPSASFSDKNVGDEKEVVISGYSISGSDATNYNLLYPTDLTANVTQRELNVTGIVGVDRIYDGSTEAVLSGTPVLNNLVAGDQVQLPFSDIQGTFATKNVGRDKEIILNAGSLTGQDADNYRAVFQSDLTADVLKKALTVLGLVAEDKVYDGTDSAAYSGHSLSGYLIEDDVNLDETTVTARFEDSNVGENIPVSIAGFSLGGADADNYELTQPSGLFADISKLLLDIVGVEVADKFFDSTTDAIFSGGRLDSVVSGDDVNLDSSTVIATFQDPEVGNNKPVDLSGFAITGSDISNYQINSALVSQGNILSEVVVLDILPTSVLRNSSEQTLLEQREILRQEIDAQADQLNVTDYTALAPAVVADIEQPVLNDAILNTPPAERDLYSHAYIEAAGKAQELTRKYEQNASNYRGLARVINKAEQGYNDLQRDIQVESGLLDTYSQNMNKAKAAVAEHDKNLAEIAQAEENLAKYEQKALDAARLGRGAEAIQYRKMAATMQELVDHKDKVIAERTSALNLIEETQQKATSAQQKIDEMKQEGERRLTLFDSYKQQMGRYESEAQRLKSESEQAIAQVEKARIAGAEAYADRAVKLKQYRADAEKNLQAASDIAASDLASRTAEKMYKQDPAVITADNARKQVAASNKAQAEAIRANLGQATLQVADRLAADAVAGTLSMTPDALRTNLVNASPQLKALEAEVESLVQQQDRELAELTELFTLRSVTAQRAFEDILKGDMTPQQRASFDQQRAQEIADMNVSIANMTGVDLSQVPSLDANGQPISQVERIALGMLQNQLESNAQISTDDVNNAAHGTVNRLNDAVGAEFGIKPTDALNDPNKAIGDLAGQSGVSISGDGIAVDKDQVIDNAAKVAAARVRLAGAHKDAAMAEAEKLDKTGNLQAVNDIERAAEAEFVKSYGMTPQEMLVKDINDRANGLKEVRTPEEMVQFYMDNNMPKQAAMAKQAMEGLAKGESPQEVMSDLLREQSGSGADRAKAARTAQAMRDAAILQAESVDKTGTFKVYNDVKSQADKEFAAVFGDTPEDLAIKALEDPEAAAGKLFNEGKDILSSPDKTMETVSGMGNLAINMVDSQVDAAFDKLEKAAGPLGGVVAAAKKLKDFGKKVANVVTFGLVDDGPSAAEKAQLKAFEAAQTAHNRALTHQTRMKAVAKYVELAKQVAQKKYQMAVKLQQAKAQVSSYVLSAKVQSKREAEYQSTAETSKQAIQELVQESLNGSVESAKTRVASFSSTPESLQRRANSWGESI